MKKLFYLGAIMLIASCSSNKYENAMSNYLQTVDNVKTDLKFKLIETKETGIITAKDSLEHFKFHRTTWKENRMPQALSDLESAKNHLDNWNKTDYRTKEERQKEYSEAKAKYESFVNETFEYPYSDNGIAKYSVLPTEQVLANKVECKYSIFNPLLKAQQEITETYVLSPDGAICYGVFKPLTELKK